jgi:DNA repair protein RecN (Recombination protein N)
LDCNRRCCHAILLGGMLIELSIRDLALFESAELELEEGLNVITGETGAGKSLALSALELLLGQRPRTKMVRAGRESARVEGRFLFEVDRAPKRLLDLLREVAPSTLDDLSSEGQLELVLGRTLGQDGRTKAYLNGRPVTQRFLRDLAVLLVEIHGQNDHQRLLEPAEQRHLLDAFGRHENKLERYRAARRDWVEAGQVSLGWARDEGTRRDRLELMRYQVRELTEAELSVEEIADLRRERERLRHAEELLSQLGGTLEGLSDGEGAALDVLRQGETLLERWEAKVEELEPAASDLREATAHLELCAAGLRRFLHGVEYSPARLAEVEERLAEVERLERKYRCDLPELVERLPRLVEELEASEAQSADLESCMARWGETREALEREAVKLTQARKRLRSKLSRAVLESLADLGLEHARFEISVEARKSAQLESPNVDPDLAGFEADQRRFGAEGADEIEFLLAANPGEGPAPLRKVASGGEAARIMLALRGALAAEQTIPTLVFDEVDAGVGGRLAPKVGQHLRRLGEHYQIICITHLPAVAAQAHLHLEVEKQVRGDRTSTGVRRLAGEDRVVVIADMIAGGGGQETARAEAERLLGTTI